MNNHTHTKPSVENNSTVNPNLKEFGIDFTIAGHIKLNFYPQNIKLYLGEMAGSNVLIKSLDSITNAQEEHNLYIAAQTHPNIAKCYGYSNSGPNSKPSLLLESFPMQRINFENGIPDLVRLDLITQLTSCISHLHSCKILHGDITTANFRLTKVDEKIIPKLFNAGGKYYSLADKTDRPFQTRLGWTCPEAMANDFVYSAASDMWALGITCWEILESNANWGCNLLAKLEADNSKGHCQVIEEYKALTISGNLSQKLRTFKPNHLQHPIWDKVYDLIDQCLILDPSKRITIDNFYSSLINLKIELN